MEKLGVFVCTGCDIAAAVKVDGLEGIARKAGAEVYQAHACLCSPEGVAELHKAVDGGKIDRLMIAACSERYKQEELRFDPQKVVSYRLGLREQVAWSQPPGEEDTQLLAEDLLRMGIARVSKMLLPKPLDEVIEPAVLVVGGGAAGLNAALAASKLGSPVVLVEAEKELGGYLAGVGELAPVAPPYSEPRPNPTPALVAEVSKTSGIQIHTGSRVKQIAGQPGQFVVDLETSSGARALRVGAIVQATGSRPYDAKKLGHLGYGRSPDVVTSLELERMLLKRELIRPSDAKSPRRVVFVQCAGSRDESHLRYCSSECCATTLRQVAAVHKSHPEIECAVVYRDLRAPGELERFYLAVQEQPRSLFTRGVAFEVVPGDPLVVKVKESLLGDDVTLEADLVVLAVGMVPNAADGEAIRQLRDARGRVEKKESETQVAAAQKIVEELKHHEGTEILNLTYRQGPDLPPLYDSFPDSHYICFPYETRRTGIYAAGTVRAPMDAAQAEEDGWGAALKAVQCIAAARRGEAVHPRAGDIGLADFFLQRCTQCKRCTEECPFGALDEDAKGTPQYNQLRCRRCGVCMGACPERIVSFPDYSVDAVASMIKAIEVPEEDEEKPRIVAFMCENDALPALDEAAARRMKWNAWVRVIPVRCLGAVNVVWIADSLSRGVDAVLLMGCKRGDDYQCHYIKGSELANKRLENVQETLNRLSLEPTRIRVVEIARNEFERVPQIFEEMAATVKEVGANPYKGF
jgi:quinone-modifying oxidoreductase, subunit QmoB